MAAAGSHEPQGLGIVEAVVALVGTGADVHDTDEAEVDAVPPVAGGAGREVRAAHRPDRTNE